MTYKDSDGIEGLTTWQLINRIYLKLGDDIQSLISVVAADIPSSAVERVKRVNFINQKRNQVGNIIVYLRSLLDVETEFGATMSQLYDWFEQNLTILVSKDKSGAEKAEAAGNLRQQVSGFMDIWAQLDQVNKPA